ncbi:MAG: DNA primase, partial [Candidatus Eisenbacteria bacterium]|nr:DNA primase [Candidatus Eisenbacteria bacterium]
MGLRGADPFVEQVRLASDILAVIGSYMELKKAGRRWKGLCPFHGEKTASFFVNPETQSYYCFGCQQGGDVFTFLMEMEKMTFPETLRSLAERAGIPMPKRRERGEGASTEERLGEAMEVAAGFYRERLAADDGAQARRYLQARGLGPETIERFGLGWAPAGWDSLLRHARRLLPERILILAGLAIEGTRGPYDRFRERVIVPIRTAGGRPVAFGGRTLGAEEPKYINSPETPLYRKGTVLFGLGEARDAIRRAGNVLVVEGYFDVIALSAAGIGEVVGTCGTALTPDQAGLLRRYSDRWTLLFDGDAAGRAAVLRALDAAVPVHPGVRIALCPTGKDPDDWVRSEGAQSVREALDRAQSPLQYLEEWAAETGLPAEEALGRVAALLARVRDPLVRDLWIPVSYT